MKDVLVPKRIFLVANPMNTLEMDLLRSELSHVRFDAAFTSQQVRLIPHKHNSVMVRV